MGIIQKVLTTVFVLCFFAGFSQGNPGLTFGGSDNDAGHAICITPDGGYLLAGSTRSFGAGSWDGYAVKLNQNCMYQWSQTFGWQHHENFYSVLPLEHGFLFLGSVWNSDISRLDIYLLKTDLLGNKIFDKLYGTSAKDVGFTIKQSDNGGFLILGYSRGYEPHGDILLIKIDELGDELWRNNYGTNYDDYSFDFYEKTDGSILMFGSTDSFYEDVHFNYQTPSADWILIMVDQDGNEIWRKSFDTEEHDIASAIIPTDDGGSYLFGSTQGLGEGSFDMLLMKVDENGNEIWQKTFGGKEYEYGISMDINTEGDLYLFGSTKSFGQESYPDFYLIKVNKQGNEIWSLAIGGQDIDYGNCVRTTANQGCALLGKTKSFGSGGFDMLMMKVSKDGVVEQLFDWIDTTDQGQLVVYPNPVISSGRIKPTNQHAIYSLKLTAVNGNIIKNYLLQPPEYRFNVQTLPPGIYIYNISKPDQQDFNIRGKLIVN